MQTAETLQIHQNLDDDEAKANEGAKKACGKEKKICARTCGKVKKICARTCERTDGNRATTCHFLERVGLVYEDQVWNGAETGGAGKAFLLGCTFV